MSQNQSTNSMPNIIIPNTTEGRAILSMMTQQGSTIILETNTQSGFKRKYPFSEIAGPAVPTKKTRYN